MTDNPLEAQRHQLVGRLTRIRGKYQQCVADVSTEIANRGSEWSIVDLLRHSTGGYYRTMLTRLLEEENPDLGGGGFNADANWRRVTDSILSDIDGVIDTAGDLTADQLARYGQRGHQIMGVVDVLKLMVDHYDEHLSQLRDEIRPREGLTQVEP